MDWMNSLFGTELSMGVQLALLFAILVVALLVIFWLFRKIFGTTASRVSKSRLPRLSVTDAAIVDDKRRLILVRRDNVEHQVMIGGPSDIVVEQNIVRASPVAQPAQHQAQPAAMAPAPAPTPVQKSAHAQESTASHGNATAAQVEPASPGASQSASIFGSTSAQVGTTVAAAGAGLAATAAQARENVSESLSDASSAIGETAKDAVESAGETVSTAASSLTGLADDMENYSVDSAATLVDTARDATDTLAAAPEIVAERSSEFMGDLASDLEDALGLDDPEPTFETSHPTSDDGKGHGSRSSKTEDEMQRLLDELAAGN